MPMRRPWLQSTLQRNIRTRSEPDGWCYLGRCVAVVVTCGLVVDDKRQGSIRWRSGGLVELRLLHRQGRSCGCLLAGLIIRAERLVLLALIRISIINSNTEYDPFY